MVITILQQLIDYVNNCKQKKCVYNFSNISLYMQKNAMFNEICAYLHVFVVQKSEHFENCLGELHRHKLIVCFGWGFFTIH